MKKNLALVLALAVYSNAFEYIYYVYQNGTTCFYDYKQTYKFRYIVPLGKACPLQLKYDVYTATIWE